MYLSYYGLARSPFEIGPEPDPFFESPAHLDALSGLIYGITENRGFISITGDSGVGKTTTLYAAVQSLGLTHPSLLWIEFKDPLVAPADLLATIVDRLNLPTALTPGGDLGSIRNRLLRLREAGKSLVMVFDAAQDMAAEQLSFIKRLAALDEEESPLFLMVFVGLPAWDEVLRRQEHQALDRRVAVRVSIPTLTPRLARDYIDFRLAAAGGAAGEVMSDAAIRALIALGNGTPGRIHTLGDHALGLGLANRHQPIAASDIRAAHSALTLAPTRQGVMSRPDARRAAALGLAAVLALAAVIVWLTPHPQAPPAPKSSDATSAATTATTASDVRPATVSVTVAPGETMQMLLRHYGLPETSDEVGIVQSLNPELGTGDAIRAGQVLRLPAPAASP